MPRQADLLLAASQHGHAEVGAALCAAGAAPTASMAEFAATASEAAVCCIACCWDAAEANTLRPSEGVPGEEGMEEAGVATAVCCSCCDDGEVKPGGGPGGGLGVNL